MDGWDLELEKAELLIPTGSLCQNEHATERTNRLLILEVRRIQAGNCPLPARAPLHQC